MYETNRKKSPNLQLIIGYAMVIGGALGILYFIGLL